MYEYPVLGVREIHDGDTFRLDLDMGFEHSAWPWLRLKGEATTLLPSREES
jgi:hypothetical protein